jgi:hypothetical protein
MKALCWLRDRHVRSGVFAHILRDEQGTTLARVSDSTDTFRKPGDISLTAYADLTIEGTGTWEAIRAVLVKVFPAYALADLELPAREFKQDLTIGEWR